MSRSDVKRLDDIRDACAEVAELVRRGRAELDSDPVLWRAVERSIEIAGEASTQLSREARAAFPKVPWTELIAVRVRLAHAYFRIDKEIMWEIASVDMPTVAEALGPIGSAQTD